MSRQKLVFSPPERSTPGYLRRARMVAMLQRKLGSDEATPEFYDELVEFLADYVVHPKKRALAKKLLWDASEAEFDEMLSALSGNDEEGASPKVETASPPTTGVGA